MRKIEEHVDVSYMPICTHQWLQGIEEEAAIGMGSFTKLMRRVLGDGCATHGEDRRTASRGHGLDVHLHRATRAVAAIMERLEVAFVEEKAADITPSSGFIKCRFSVGYCS